MSDFAYSLRGVEQVYGGRTVLSIPELSIPKGEVFTILGPNGSGKTTLLKFLALLSMPTRGSVTLNLEGREISGSSASIEDRRRVAMVFQRPVLLSRSVSENVAYGLTLRQARTKLSPDYLEKWGLKRLAKAQAHTLSGGEIQRVALARALILQPDILLLDEPTANLDPASGMLIELMIGEAHRESHMTIVLVTHNLFQARRLATRAMLLMDGALVEEGPAEAMFDHPADKRTARFIRGEMIF